MNLEIRRKRKRKNQRKSFQKLRKTQFLQKTSREENSNYRCQTKENKSPEFFNR